MGVAQQILEPGPAPGLPTLLLVAAHAAEADKGAASRLVGVQSGALEVGGFHVDVEAHLVVHLPLLDAAAKEVEQFHGGLGGGRGTQRQTRAMPRPSTTGWSGCCRMSRYRHDDVL